MGQIILDYITTEGRVGNLTLWKIYKWTLLSFPYECEFFPILYTDRLRGKKTPLTETMTNMSCAEVLVIWNSQICQLYTPGSGLNSVPTKLYYMPESQTCFDFNSSPSSQFPPPHFLFLEGPSKYLDCDTSFANHFMLNIFVFV